MNDRIPPLHTSPEKPVSIPKLLDEIGECAKLNTLEEMPFNKQSPYPKPPLKIVAAFHPSFIKKQEELWQRLINGDSLSEDDLIEIFEDVEEILGSGIRMSALTLLIPRLKSRFEKTKDPAILDKIRRLIDWNTATHSDERKMLEDLLDELDQ